MKLRKFHEVNQSFPALMESYGLQEAREGTWGGDFLESRGFVVETQLGMLRGYEG